MTNNIQANRRLFLDELRSGKYKKGTLKSDEKTGDPIIKCAADDDGYCACAVMVHLWPGKNEGSMTTARDALGLSVDDCRYIQHTLNDSPLTMSEIADRIETEVFATGFELISFLDLT